MCVRACVRAYVRACVCLVLGRPEPALARPRTPKTTSCSRIYRYYIEEQKEEATTHSRLKGLNR